MSKYPGRVLSATPPAVSVTGASGIWTQEEVAQYNAEGVWPAQPLPYDPYFQDTVLLLHGDGNQGATNFSNISDPVYLAFKDNSDNNFPITVNGDAYGDNFGPFALEDGMWGNYFNAAGYGFFQKTSPPSYLYDWTSTNFTLEFWIYVKTFSNNGNGNSPVIGNALDTGLTEYWSFGPKADGKVRWYYYNGSAINFDTTSAISSGEWHHLAFVNNAGSIKIYVDGVADATGSISGTPQFSSGTPFSIARVSNVQFDGYLSNLRISQSAVYTSDFTPSTTPLTADGNTALLICQSNRFVDNSTNNVSLSIYNDVKVTVFNPFGELPDGVNGSGYFGGDTDYITGTSNAAYQFNTGDFTVECWLYTTALVGSAAKIFQYATDGNFSSGGYGLEQTSVSNLTWGRSTGTVTLSTSVPVNEWFHFAIVRSSGTLTAYINGTSVYSAADSYNYNYGGTWPFSIGSGRDGSGTFNNDYTGFISNFRVVKGTAVYTTAFTPPASPLTAVSGTELLTCQYAGTVRNVGFIDSGPYDFPITRNGNTTQGTFSPFSKPDGAWANYFDGSTASLDTPSDAAFAMGTGDFTIQFFLYAQNLASVPIIVDLRPASTNGNYPMVYYNGSNLIYYVNSGARITGSALSNNTFYHIAVSRISGSTRLFIDGVQSGSTWTDSTNYAQSKVRIGASGFDGANRLNGYVSNLRIEKGNGYSSITVPTAPLTAISGTSLLTCQSNRFVDNSSNAFAITVNGTPKVTPFSPFPITTAYSPSVNGGAGYFDGSTDWLRLNNVLAFGTNDWSFETWVYPTTFANINYIIDFRPTSTQGAYFLLNIQTTGKFRVYVSSAARIDADNAINLNEWTHVCVQEVSGVMTMYVNGVAQSTTWTNTTNFLTAANRPIIGLAGYDSSGAFNGYMAGMRAVIGGVAYSPPFSTPTAPPTAITNTEFLLNFTNAGILDNTGFNALETIGNAQVDTNIVKFGTGSMEFDGTGDALVGRPFPEFNFSTGDFTVEFWLYLSVTPSAQSWAMSFGPNGSGGVSRGWGVRLHDGSTAGLSFVYQNSGSVANRFGNLPSATTWAHVAFCRDSTVMRCFVNGVQLGSTWTLPYSSIDNTSTTDYYGIGGYDNSNNGYPGRYWFNGLIDDLRITKGVARYTTDFDPPTLAFRNIGA